ncbi:NERD domain-containing protein [Bacillus sp. FJAT-49732]|uniref:NERD domain-containing protein n=1 Tax=Lederbergia citrisecunda TaxID=2833583 RepID=A0A942YLE9_9BACI|nr:nuclease-related domain-containing protein [Lederbergia citrisecunda]MBS4200582.1 NERD domain-containing protein [Lederbergia citrisecunda]
MEALMLIILIGLFFLLKNKRFRDTNYKTTSGNGFFETFFNKGNYGEYLTFTTLQRIGGYHKLLTNIYLPKKNGTTTEIDVIMISRTGIYVFESKNYSGWIFGDEKNRNWVQTLRGNHKNNFFNPIWQNKGHINALKKVIEIHHDYLYKSYIIFSNRCTLKKITVRSPNVKVIKRNSLLAIIKKDIELSFNVISIDEVDQLYAKLQKYSNVSKDIKKKHIERSPKIIGR